ncbi:nitric oxide synthase-interacting protein homolog [Leguminivora glycinivorella]|uniref:nitric oxide synthase-interacting protein homolog n=1 Tax=Leguminivora glycinivorella TaxID=1035111 RepID=UPI00200FE8C2|nr:nitric oxide synthase-interacting protein homolog [Leguminivora glycinivorella]XP_047996956.1 nitric oxide synthase-interacting protein homolog [Leguminivora glycinivorella]
MKGDTVLIFVIFVLISVNMCSSQKMKKKEHDKKKLNRYQANGNDGRKVKVTNWGNYGWNSGQEVDARILKEVLEGLAIFEKGEGCPLGKGKCESVSAYYVLTKLISNLLNKKDNNDNENGNDNMNDNEHHNNINNNNDHSMTLSDKTNSEPEDKHKKTLKNVHEHSKLTKLLFVSNDFEKKRLSKKLFYF